MIKPGALPPTATFQLSLQATAPNTVLPLAPSNNKVGMLSFETSSALLVLATNNSTPQIISIEGDQVASEAKGVTKVTGTVPEDDTRDILHASIGRIR